MFFKSREGKHNDVIYSGYQVAEWLQLGRRSYKGGSKSPMSRLMMRINIVDD